MKRSIIDTLEQGIKRERLKLLKEQGNNIEEEIAVPELVQEMEEISGEHQR